MKHNIKTILLFFFLVLLYSCNKDNYNRQSDNVTFPIGRSFLGKSEVTLTLNKKAIAYEIIDDHCGAYWIKVLKSDFSKGDTLLFKFTRCNEELALFQEDPSEGINSLLPSYFIDSKNESILSKAKELCNGLETSVEKAKKIHSFMCTNIYLDLDYQDSFLRKASLTLDEGYGTCMNFSRLYVALCRAANIPARSVWGVVYGHDNDRIYDYHHQWAEIMDEEGYWHPADFTYSKTFDLNDVRYLDLIHNAEENSIILNRKKEEILLDDLEYPHDYPATKAGRLGFRLKRDYRPDSMIVQYTYVY